MRHQDLCRRLFDAFAAGDAETVRELCSPQLVAIQNRGPEMGLDALLGFIGAVQAAVRDFRYEDIVCHATDRGFVEDHLVRGSLPDGSELRIAACVIGEVENGRIVSLRETVDGAAAAPLLRALS